MRFRKVNGRQVLDLKNDLIITYDHMPVTAVSQSSAPTRVIKGTYITDVQKLGFIDKLKATLTVINFIWFGKHGN